MNKAIKENTTRIIGAILIIAGVIAFKQISWLALAFFIPAAIMIAANKKLAQAEFKQFISIFKKIPEKKYFLTVMYDVLSWFGLFFATYSLGTLMKGQIEKMMPGLIAIGPGGLLIIIVLTLLYVIIMLDISVIIYSAFKGMIWLTILDKKIEWSYFTRFTLLNAVWFALWVLPAIIIAIGLKQDYFLPAVIAAVIVDVHLTTILHRAFTEKRLLWNSLGTAFRTGFGKIKQFLLPYSYMAFACIILLNIFWIVPEAQNIMTFASILLMAFYMAWYRLYMSAVLDKIT